jgi:(S)-mandelate dehydrogenase
MPFKIGPKQFIDFALHPYWTIPSFINGVPHMANFDMEGYDFNRMESRALADWSYLDQLRAAWPGNLVVKGVLNPLDAVTLVNAGVDAIQVSSHGSRQLDSAPAPIRMLGEIRNVVGSDFPLFYDSGIRSGEDIVKAYAMGADFVFLGRPFLYALAAKGEKGLKDLVTVLTQELQTTLAQIGQHSIKLIKQNVDDYIL